jgi:hypothetical protein
MARSGRALRPFAMLGALAVAPWPGIALLTVTFLSAGSVQAVPWLAVLMIAPYAYATAAVLVLPVLLVWPATRRPGYVLAAIWGACAAWTPPLAFAAQQHALAEVWSGGLVAPLVFGAAGALSGLTYAWLVRRASFTKLFESSG